MIIKLDLAFNSEPLLQLGLFHQNTPSWIKVMGVVVGWGGGPCYYCVSPSPFGLDFRTSDSGLTIFEQIISDCSSNIRLCNIGP